MSEGAGGGPELSLRDATPDDYPAAVAVLLAAYDEYRPAVPTDLWQGYAKDIANVAGRAATSTLILAERDGVLVGAVTFAPGISVYPPAGGGDHWPETHASLRLLAVSPDARGGGVARVLMTECIHRARALGRTHLGLHTTQLMQIAKQMYQRMGFQRVPSQDLHSGPMTIEAYELDLRTLSV